ncbi:MAG: hypothetical protein ABFC12_04325 [Methanobacterium sp.]
MCYVLIGLAGILQGNIASVNTSKLDRRDATSKVCDFFTRDMDRSGGFHVDMGLLQCFTFKFLRDKD